MMLQDIIAGLKANTITELRLAGKKLGDAGVVAIANALKTNTSLKIVLDLSDNDIGDEGAEALAEMLKVNSTLECVEIYYNHIGIKGAKALADALKINTSLTDLDLEQNDILDEGAIALADALKINGSLTEIRLTANDIHDDGIKAIAEMLPTNQTLKYMTLCHNEMSYEAEKILFASILHNHTLERLRISRTIPEDVKERLWENEHGVPFDLPVINPKTSVQESVRVHLRPKKESWLDGDTLEMGTLYSMHPEADGLGFAFNSDIGSKYKESYTPGFTKVKKETTSPLFSESKVEADENELAEKEKLKR